MKAVLRSVDRAGISRGIALVVMNEEVEVPSRPSIKNDVVAVRVYAGPICGEPRTHRKFIDIASIRTHIHAKSRKRQKEKEEPQKPHPPMTDLISDTILSHSFFVASEDSLSENALSHSFVASFIFLSAALWAAWSESFT